MKYVVKVDKMDKRDWDNVWTETVATFDNDEDAVKCAIRIICDCLTDEEDIDFAINELTTYFNATDLYNDKNDIAEISIDVFDDSGKRAKRG